MTTRVLPPPESLVTVITVTMNNQEVIEQCIDSVLGEAGNELNVEMIVIDNDSGDETLSIVRKKNVRLIANQANIGFCAANNVGLRKASGQYILFLNPDARITPDFLRGGIEILKEKPGVGLLTGKVLRMLPDGSPVLTEGRHVIDTAGIQIRADRQAVDIGMGETDNGQYDRPAVVSAISGAVCLCKAEALADLAVEGEVFDELFFMYKEDVDLGWRAQRLGWTCLYTPSIIAFHARGWQSGKQARSNMPKEIRYHSYKNRRIMILKNEKFDRLADIFSIFGFETASFAYSLVFEPNLLRTYRFIAKNLPRIRRWRRVINERADNKKVL